MGTGPLTRRDVLSDVGLFILMAVCLGAAVWAGLHPGDTKHREKKR